MRVNISYSVNLEDVPNTVGDLVGASKEKFFSPVSKKIDNVLVFLSQDNQKKAIESIDEIRRELALLDTRLLDCSSILEGYQQTVLNANTSASSEE
jgi:hypothetical protein